ncbi:leucine-rich repeat protein [Butyrivibrio sp. INlla16]|uniref:leucine-rich repeat protein n=1 Tax=Butyrivibrio sp. INlla16 TaxID=1520807 RepID=UPI00087EA205|nr:leucine-rich repeat protein [Butyrivibrio sp. INlla16]SDB21734.1 Leucine rich repeat-containing protein [Butyrivibrio sp. INlla16]
MTMKKLYKAIMPMFMASVIFLGGVSAEKIIAHADASPSPWQVFIMKTGARVKINFYDDPATASTYAADPNTAFYFHHTNENDLNNIGYDSASDSITLNNVTIKNYDDGTYIYSQMPNFTNIKGLKAKGKNVFDEDVYVAFPCLNGYTNTFLIDLDPGASFTFYASWWNGAEDDLYDKLTVGDGVTKNKTETPVTGGILAKYTFERKAIDIATLKDKATLSPPTADYTGAAITPEVKITGLTKDVDFTVAYTNNIEPGTATVTITGIGAYTGSFTLEYTINKKEYKQEEVKDEKTGASYEVTTNADGTTVATYKTTTNKKAKKIKVPETVTLPDGSTAKVTQIGSKAFKDSNATQITIPKSVKKISAKAFEGSSAKKIIIKTDKKAKVSIGKGAFKKMKAKNTTIQIKGCSGKPKQNLKKNIQKQASSGTTVK